MEKWQRNILILTLLLIIADELGYFWWKRIHPNSEWNGAFGKNPLQLWESDEDIINDWNGLRPGGGNTRGTSW